MNTSRFFLHTLIAAAAMTAPAYADTLNQANYSSGTDDITLTGDNKVDSLTVAGSGDVTISGNLSSYTDAGTTSILLNNSGSLIFALANGQSETSYSGIGTISTKTNAGNAEREIIINQGVSVTAQNLTNGWGLKGMSVDGSLEITDTFKFGTGNQTVNVTGVGTISAGTFLFANAGRYNFSGVTLEVGAGGIVADPSSGNNWGFSLNLGAMTVKAKADSTTAAFVGVWTPSYTLTDALTGTTYDTNGYNVTIAQGLSGSGRLVKKGEGTLSLTGNNTYSGGTDVLGGVLKLTGNTVSNGAVTVSGGGLVVSGTSNFAKGITITNNGAVTLGGNVTLSETITVSSGSLTFADGASVVLADGFPSDVTPPADIDGYASATATIYTGSAANGNGGPFTLNVNGSDALVTGGVVSFVDKTTYYANTANAKYSDISSNVALKNIIVADTAMFTIDSGELSSEDVAIEGNGTVKIDNGATWKVSGAQRTFNNLAGTGTLAYSGGLGTAENNIVGNGNSVQVLISGNSTFTGTLALSEVQVNALTSDFGDAGKVSLAMASLHFANTKTEFAKNVEVVATGYIRSYGYNKISNGAGVTFSGDVAGGTLVAVDDGDIIFTGTVVLDKYVAKDTNQSSDSITVFSGNNSLTITHLDAQGTSAVKFEGAAEAVIDETSPVAATVSKLTGSGTLHITGKKLNLGALNGEKARDFTGDINVNAGGTLNLVGQDTLGWNDNGLLAGKIIAKGDSESSLASIVFEEGGTHGFTLSKAIELKGNTSVSGAKIRAWNGKFTVSGVDNEISSDLQLGKNLTVDVASAGELKLSGALSFEGDQSFTKTGEGKLVFAGKREYDGTKITVSAGTLGVEQKAVLNLGSGTGVLDASKVTGTGTVKYKFTGGDGSGSGVKTSAEFTGIVDYSGNLNWATASAVDNAAIGNNQATLRLSGGDLWGKHAKTFNNKIEFASDYGINLGGSSLTLAGDVSAIGQTLRVFGSNELKLSGANIEIGTLAISAGKTMISGSNVSIGDIQLSGGILVANSTLGSGAITITGESGTLQIGNDVTLTNAVTIVLGESSVETAIISGAGMLNVDKITISKAAEQAALSIVTDVASSYTYQIVSGDASWDDAWTDSNFVLNGWDGWDAAYDTTSGVLTLTMAVPEPSAFGLLAGVGALALVASRRRRRSR